jgi:hypothetical protein
MLDGTGSLVAGQLRADLGGIGRMASSLGQLADEFAALTTVADEAGATGNAELAGALSEFATGWSDKRNQLIGQLRELAQDANEAVREYTATDMTLARDLGTR